MPLNEAYDETMTLALQAAAVAESRSLLTLSQVRALETVIEALRDGDHPRARADWSTFIERSVNAGGAIDVSALVQLVLRESYLNATEDLRVYAEKVRYFNTTSKLIHEALERARAIHATLEKASLQSVMESHISDLDKKLNAVGDDGQLANVDLQNLLQQQQKTLQLMSNISKVLYDTALSVIRKMG